MKPEYYGIGYYSLYIKGFNVDYERALNFVPVFLRRDIDGNLYLMRLLPKEEFIGKKALKLEIDSLDKLFDELDYHPPFVIKGEIYIYEISPKEYGEGLFPDMTLMEKEMFLGIVIERDERGMPNGAEDFREYVIARR